MVKTDSGKTKKSAVTSRLFLNSVNKWHKSTGIHCCVDQVGKMVEGTDKTKTTLPVNITVCEDMPKCRARVIGEDGEVVKIEDEVGDLKDKIEIIKNPQEFTLWIKLSVVDAENEEYKVYNLSSGFPLINFAFIESGDIEPNNNKNLVFTYDEIVEVLEGLEFKVLVETRSFGGNNYPVLIPKAL